MSAGPDIIPSLFHERMIQIYGAQQAAEIREQLFGPPPLSFRVIDASDPESVHEDCARHGVELDEVPWTKGAFRVRAGDRISLQQTDLARRGAVFIQSLSSMAAVEALEVQPGLHALDLCAAPGGKTAMIALRQQGRGVLVANDRSRSRLARLRTVLEQHGVSHVELSCNSGESFGGTHASCFDRVLVDAPCSGEGMFRCDDAEAWAEWGLGRIRRLAKQQERLLIAGLRCLRPGGVLVYSTCTHAPEENEAVVHRVLSRIDVDVEVESLPGPVPAGHPGLGTWEGVEFDPQVTLSRRLIPDGWCTGFFLARFRRRNDSGPNA